MDLKNNIGLLLVLVLVSFVVAYRILILLGYKKVSKEFGDDKFFIIFATEKERDRALSLIERDKEETELLKKQARDFKLK